MEKQPKFIGDRIVAGLVDYILIFSFLFYFAYEFGEPNSEGGYTLSGIFALAPILFWFMMTVGMELLFKATLGNLLVGLKVVSLNEEYDELTFGQSFKRHLVDLIDMSFFGLVGILLIQKTEKNQRLGDLWANTTVVKK